MSGEALVARGFISREVISVNLATGHVVSAIAVPNVQVPPAIPTGVLVGPGGREAFVFSARWVRGRPNTTASKARWSSDKPGRRYR